MTPEIFSKGAGAVGTARGEIASSRRRSEIDATMTPDSVRFYDIWKGLDDDREDADLLHGGPPDPRGGGDRVCPVPEPCAGGRYLASLASSCPIRRADRPADRAGGHLAV